MAKTTPPKQGHAPSTPHANRCGAKTRSGKPCKQRPIKGGKRCRMHGGAEPNARRAASANVLEAKVRGQLARMDITPADSPAQQLARIVGEQVAFLPRQTRRGHRLMDPRQPHHRSRRSPGRSHRL